jgi:adenosylmethionine-8-amino-7-oxononanoate aminotransferase
MAKINLKQSYRDSDVSHAFRGLNVPSAFNKSGSKIYIEGKGTRVKDIEGKEYIDFTACGLVAMVGYGNQELAEVAKAQMSKLHHFPDYGARVNAFYVYK